MYRNTMVNVDLDAIESNTKNIINKFNNYEYYGFVRDYII